MISRDSLIFASKTALSALLAIYIALFFNLDNPGWAVATSFITTQAFSTSTISKSIFRLLGTLLGAIGAVIIVSNLSNQPLFFSTTMSLWTAVCLYFALLDRSPKGYMYMLAGYTISMIGFPSIYEPQNIFTVSVDRVQEISIGILCSTLVQKLIYPKQIFPVIHQAMNQWINNNYTIFNKTLDIQHNYSFYNLFHDLAAQPLNLEKMIDHLKYGNLDEKKQYIMMNKILLETSKVLPNLYAVRHRLELLTQQDISEDIKNLTLKFKVFFEHDHKIKELNQIQVEIHTLKQLYIQTTNETEILIFSLLNRFDDLIDIFKNIIEYQTQLNTAQYTDLKKSDINISYKYHNTKTAMLASITVFIAINFSCFVWYMTGTYEGYNIPMIVAIACSFFGGLDSTLPTLKKFLNYFSFATAIGFVYTLFILPSVTDIITLIIALTPIFFLFGWMMSRPSSTFMGMIYSANMTGFMKLKDNYSPDILFGMNNFITTLVGLIISILFLNILRDRSPKQIAEIMEQDAINAFNFTIQQNIKSYAESRDYLYFRLLDQIHQLLPRLRQKNKSNIDKETNIFRTFRFSMNLLDIKYYLNQLDPLDPLYTELNQLYLCLNHCFQKHDLSNITQTKIQIQKFLSQKIVDSYFIKDRIINISLLI